MWPYVRISSVSLIRPLPVRHRTEYVAGVVEQGDVGRRPAHVGDIVGSRSIQRLDLRLVEQVAGGQPQQRSRPEQVVEQLRRSQQRPHPLEGGADLRDTAQLLAQLASGHVDRYGTTRRGRAKNSPST